jgi:hypothetical protein
MSDNHIICHLGHITVIAVKTTVRYDDKPTVVEISNTINIRYWWGCEAIGTHSLLVEIQNGIATLKENFTASSQTKYHMT